MHRTRSRSKSRTRACPAETEGYSCTLYHDYLILFGGINGTRIFDQPTIYNLKEKRIEDDLKRRSSTQCGPRFNHAACLYEKQGTVFIYGGQGRDRDQEQDIQRGNHRGIRITMDEDFGGWRLEPGIQGAILPSPISSIRDDKLYLYQPDEFDGNFGSLHCYDFNSEKFINYETSNDNMKLYEPCENAIFSGDKLYLFTENVDHSPRKRQDKEHLLEDVYVLDLSDQNEKRPQWRRVCSGDQQVPGGLTNISMTEADGIIYVFGLEQRESEKSVLWAYNTDEETWTQVKDSWKLNASPNQRAVVYKDQLLIVNWSYPNRSINIQYQNLGDLEFTLKKKRLCKDQPEGLIRDAKKIFDGRLFADITFEVEGEEIPAHKAILAYRSDYFMRMFTSGMSESHNTRIPIPHIKSHIFKAILQYIYCNEVELDEQLALDLIPIVDEYLMKGLKGLCEKYLCKQLRKDNVVDMLIVADRHEIEELKKACFRFILKNLHNIDENEEMTKLSKSLFVELLKFNNNSLASSKGDQDKEPEVCFTNGLGYSMPTKSTSSYRRRSRSRS